MAKDEKTTRFGKVSFGGYKPEEVDEYITTLKVELEEQRARVADLTDKLRYLVRVVEEMQQGGAVPPAAPAPAPMAVPVQKDDSAEKAAELLAAIRTRLSETAESVAALFGSELASYAELAESLEKMPRAEEKTEPAEPVAVENLSFDTMCFETLRKDIEDLAEEKYIPGQEDPTIVADDLKSIVVRPVSKQNAETGNAEAVPEKEEKSGDGDVRFSLFDRR